MTEAGRTTRLPAEHAEEMYAISQALNIPMTRMIAEGFEAKRPSYLAQMAAKAQTINVDQIYKDQSTKRK